MCEENGKIETKKSKAGFYCLLKYSVLTCVFTYFMINRRFCLLPQCFNYFG